MRANVNRAETQGAPLAAFFAKPLFDEIRAFIQETPASYRVASLGLHPSIALHNGFHTVDGYHFMYPLEYKHRFRKVIAEELNRSATLAQNFDGWGSRCYVLSAELGRNPMLQKSNALTKPNEPDRVNSLAINVDALAALGARYLLSAVPIENARDIGLVPLRRFEHPKSLWTIELYALR
jgi:hypothetical protein